MSARCGLAGSAGRSTWCNRALEPASGSDVVDLGIAPLKIFISYRRSDTQDFAGRLADRLRVTPGIDRVFIDVEDIAPGDTFPSRLASALAESDVCLIVIGPRWSGPRQGASARLFDGDDFVRREVREALATDSRSLPVLANGAIMPAAAELPDDLVGLLDLNAVSIRHGDFDRDVDSLIDVLLRRKKPGVLRAYLHRHPVQSALLQGLAGGLAGIFVLVVGAAVHHWSTGHSLDQSMGGRGPVVLLILAVLCAGAGLPMYVLARRLRRARRPA